MQRLKRWSHKHKIASAVLTTLLLCATVGFAYYIATVTFSGENTGTLGKGSATAINETMVVTVPTAMVPGAIYPMTATVKPATAITLEPGAKLAATYTTVPSSCPNTWFAIETTGAEVKGFSAGNLLETGGTKEAVTIPAATVTPIKELGLRFIGHPTENETVCNEAKLTVKLTVTGPGH